MDTGSRKKQGWGVLPHSRKNFRFLENFAALLFLGGCVGPSILPGSSWILIRSHLIICNSPPQGGTFVFSQNILLSILCKNIWFIA